MSWDDRVTQAEDDLFAPVRAQLWRLLGVFGLIAVVVLAIAVWFSLRLAAPPVGRTRTSPNTRRCRGSKKTLSEGGFLTRSRGLIGPPRAGDESGPLAPAMRWARAESRPAAKSRGLLCRVSVLRDRAASRICV